MDTLLEQGGRGVLWVACTLVGGTMLVGGDQTYNHATAPVTLVINGQTLFSGPADFRNDRLMLPVETLSAAGCRAYVDDQSGVLVLSAEGANVAVMADQPRLLVFASDLPPDQWSPSAKGPFLDPEVPLYVAQDGSMATAPMLIDGQVLVPIRMLYGALDVDPRTGVTWDSATRTVTIAAPGWTPSQSAHPLAFHAPQFLVDELRRGVESQL